MNLYRVNYCPTENNLYPTSPKSVDYTRQKKRNTKPLNLILQFETIVISMAPLSFNVEKKKLK